MTKFGKPSFSIILMVHEDRCLKEQQNSCIVFWHTKFIQRYLCPYIIDSMLNSCLLLGTVVYQFICGCWHCKRHSYYHFETNLFFYLMLPVCGSIHCFGSRSILITWHWYDLDEILLKEANTIHITL